MRVCTVQTTFHMWTPDTCTHSHRYFDYPSSYPNNHNIQRQIICISHILMSSKSEKSCLPTVVFFGVFFDADRPASVFNRNGLGIGDDASPSVGNFNVSSDAWAFIDFFVEDFFTVGFMAGVFI